MDPDNIAGIDVGLTLVEPTSGVCRTGRSGDVVTHTYSDRLSRSNALGKEHHFAVLAIDGPVLRPDELHYEPRACEKVFVWGEFQKRCKCGESWVRGTGQALRRAGVETAHAFRDVVSSSQDEVVFPRIFGDHNIVEAFPNAFLGVSLQASVFASASEQSDSVPRRGEKFDWLYDQWLSQQGPAHLKALLRWDRPEFWRQVETNRHHDERAALICALTGVCAARGSYVAVGDAVGGYFYLPPWNTWAPWARDAVAAGRTDRRLPRAIDVWVDGKRYAQRDELPAAEALANPTMEPTARS
jgi:hypothetical protein